MKKKKKKKIEMKKLKELIFIFKNSKMKMF